MPEKNNTRHVHRLVFIFMSLIAVSLAEAAEVRSPDGAVLVEVSIADRDTPVYRIRYRDEVVVGESRLGLRFADHAGLDEGFRIGSVSETSADTTWEQPWGERRKVRDRHNEILVTFESVDGPPREFALRVRAFDDGVGFRYEVPEQEYLDDVRIVDELTEFRLPVDATAWWVPGFEWNRYEYIYRQTPIEEISLATTPMTVRLASGVHLSLHEAALVDYAGYVLDQRRDGIFKTNLTPSADGIRVRTQAPFRTPWRTIQIAPDAAGLLDSSLILNLNEPNALGDVSWVEPGKYIGIWWAMHLGLKTWGSGDDHGATTTAAMHYIDFASENGFDGVLVEGWNTGWDGDWFHNGAIFSFTESYPDFDLPAVARYARDNGVRLVGHHETSGHVSNYEDQLDDALDLYESLGVRQV